MTRHIIRLTAAFLAVSPAILHSQDGSSAYAFLRLPASSRIAALGGYTVSMVEAEPSLAFHNPALMGGETDGMASVGYMSYIAGINAGSAIYTKAFRERSAWGAGATYINYGLMRETTENGDQTGVFSVQDVALHAIYSYDLSDKWRGGLSLKALYSTLAEYSSFGLAVDAGLSYFDAESDLSFGLTLNNIGAQLKPYYDERQKIPWDLRAGFSKRMAHAPVRLSVTAMYLNQWQFKYIENTTIATDDNFMNTLMKHLVFGLEFLPSNNFWIGIGYNPKQKMDMSLSAGNGMGGFSAGGGIKVSRFHIGASVARFHPSATSLLINVAVSLAERTP